MRRNESGFKRTQGNDHGTTNIPHDNPPGGGRSGDGRAASARGTGGRSTFCTKSAPGGSDAAVRVVALSLHAVYGTAWRHGRFGRGRLGSSSRQLARRCGDGDP